MFHQLRVTVILDQKPHPTYYLNEHLCVRSADPARCSMCWTCWIPEVLFEGVPANVGKLLLHASLPSSDGWVRGQGRTLGLFGVDFGKTKEELREDRKGNGFYSEQLWVLQGGAAQVPSLSSEGLSRPRLPPAVLCTPSFAHILPFSSPLIGQYREDPYICSESR